MKNTIARALFSILAACAAAPDAPAGPVRASADYAVAAEFLDAGGSRSSSAAYDALQSIGQAVEGLIAASADYENASGDIPPLASLIGLNYVTLAASPATVHGGAGVTLSYACDFGTWDFRGKAVDIYLAAVKAPVAAGYPSTVADALAGGRVYLFRRGMAGAYRYTGRIIEPTWSGVSFPPAGASGTLAVEAPADPSFAGEWAFATAFIYRGGGFVRTDLPVENSAIFEIE